MTSLISFDISSDFGFFKKPDINKISLTYNLPPKPAILGIIGSILGMGGINKQYENLEYLQLESLKSTKKQDKIDIDLIQIILERLKFKARDRLLELLNTLKDIKKGNFDHGDEYYKIIEELESEIQYPEYYKRLKHLKIGIKPNGNFPFNKIVNRYNSRNSYFGGGKYENIICDEQLLIKPSYRIYVYDDTKEELIDELSKRIEDNNPIFMPYLGKNEFIVSFDNIQTIDNVRQIKNTEHVSSVFITNRKSIGNSDEKNSRSNPLEKNNDSCTIEGLPTGFRFIENYPTSYSQDMHYKLQVVQFAESCDLSSIDLEKGSLLEIDGCIIYLF